MCDINTDLVKFAFFKTIKKVINKDSDKELKKFKLLPEDEVALFQLSKKHDLAHLVCQGLEEYGYELSTKGKQDFNNARMVAIVRYEQLIYEYNRIVETLNNSKIPFVPLKGAVLRDYYDEAWYRTSCDIDILVKKDDLQKAIKALCTINNYKAEKRANYHDISLYSPSNIHLELHFTILENQENIDLLLSRVWDFVKLKNGSLYEYRQTNEYLIFHVIAHILYHFMEGGCGVRTIVDFWIVSNRLSINELELNAMLEKCGIRIFYNSIIELTKVWFEGNAHTEKTLKLENYILNGGVYGNFENRMKVAGTKIKGKKSYALRRIFCPYEIMINKYPILRKHKWLLPVYEVVRWVETIFKGKARNLKQELAIIETNSGNDKNDFKNFLTEIGL